ncbi:tubulin polyglutamylase [Holotrichia oblita]|uniref:Tubulin polyglutamylase n=2 Tax=Holotrichia oblita TaxID=644536 RepID=A0ACB9SX16_HOLOL|nr:tubulin polyglutamylase [Holotrichia oblita]KAI4459023.1 tubulin polyglutamylase [Holotrichia oblita]
MVDTSSISLPVLQSDSSDWSSETDVTTSVRSKFTIKSSPPKKEPIKAEEPAPVPAPKKRRRKAISVCLTNCRYDVIRRITQKLGYKEVNEIDNWNLYWTDLSISIERCKEMKRFQKINHFPGMLEICRKDLLARNLNRMQRLFPKDYNFFPKTWCLPADLGDALTYSRLRKNKTYILKPDAGSQGRGIVITKNLKEVKPSDRVICQVYLTRPYLIDGFKFDLRVYTLITSCEPLRVYIYREGLVRFATSRYKEPTGVNITNVFMHLTNYAVNKHSRTYTVDNEAGSKRKLTWLNSYLRNLGHDVEKLWRSIDDVIIKTIMAAWPVLKHSYLACFPNHDVIPACCELLGTDIILDKRLNPQILEVNHSPSFHTDTELDCEVKEALISDMFAMLHLEHCDKRKIMREDRKRIRERLLQGISNNNPGETKNFSEYFRHELKHRGGFRLVYPTMNGDHCYDKFFHQGQSSLYCDTASSKARESAQAALRDEMQLKAKLEASKRIPMLKPPTKAKSDMSNQVPSLKRPTQTLPSFILNSFEPQMIVESEEKERLLKLSQRDYLVRSNGLLEYVYFSMKINGMLRPQDERKYAIYDKLKTLSDAKMKTKGPAITDLLEGLNKNEMVFHGANIPSTWTFLSSERLAERKHKSKLSSVKVKHNV